MPGIVLGLCGREGAGKSTVAAMLCKTPTVSITYITCDNIEKYVLDTLFGSKQTASERQAVKDRLYYLLHHYLDSDFTFPSRYKVPITLHYGSEKREWIEYSMADPLKKICSIIFEIDYEILQGLTSEARKTREVLLGRPYPLCGVLTGRKCLEFLGTDVLRNNLDADIWINIFRRECQDFLENGINVVLSDMRFINEKRVIDELEGCIWVLYREPQDLQLTEEDKKQHRAKWEFLTFAGPTQTLDQKIRYIHNAGTLDDLCEQVKKEAEQLVPHG